MELRDDDLTEAKRQIDAWVKQHSPPHAMVHARAQELNHAKQFHAEYGRAAGQFEVEFSSLVGTVDRINFIRRDTWPPHRSIQYALLAHNLKPLRSVMDRLSKGYYEDALALLRVGYETLIRLVFISLHHEDPWGALTRRPTPPTPPFNATGFVRDQLRLGWATSYSVLSAFTHSNVVSVLDSLKRAEVRQGEPERFGPSIDFDRNRIELVLPQLHFALLGYLRFAVDRLVGNELRAQVPQSAVAIESVEVMMFVVRTSPKPYWRAVADDLDYIFELIHAAEGGTDWVTIARSRPVVLP